MRFPFTDMRGLLRSREEIFREATDARQFDSVYFAMLIFSCLIALLGLLLNSPAIIIGGMLISPMMGPILTCGIALTTADGPLGRKASWNLAMSTTEVILIAVLATWLSPLKDATPEILARTNPNLMDLLVAFFSGLAGTLAMSSRKSGLTILPGVAIATAVMPPLATVGYGLSTGQWLLARGAFMLFSTNVMAIIISAELVFFLVGFRPGRRKLPEGTRLLVRHRTLIAFGILLALSIPLMRTLLQAAQQVKLRHAISDAITEESAHSGCRLDKIDLWIGRDVVLVDAVVQTSKFIEPAEVERWQEVISAKIGRRVHLALQQLQIAHREPAIATSKSRDFVAGGTIRPATPEPPPSPAQQLEKLQSRAQESLQGLLSPAGIGPVQLLSLAVQPDGVLLLQLTGIEAAPSADATWTVTASALANELHSPVQVSGTLLVSSASATVRYANKAVRPSPTALRAANQFLAQWKDQPNMHYAFVAGGPPDAITAKRLEYLRGRYPESVPMPPITNPAAEVGEASSIRIQMLHRVDAHSLLAAPNPPPTTNPTVPAPPAASSTEQPATAP